MEQATDIRYRGMLAVALPIALGSFVQFVVVFTDNFFLAQLSEKHLNAAGNAGLAYVSLLMLLVGLGSGIQIMTARRNGEGLLEEAGIVLSTGLRLAVVLGAVLLAGCMALRLAFPHWLADAEMATLLDDFIAIRGWGFLCYPASLAIQAFYMGLARTRMLLIASLVTAGVNIGLDYALIFGNFGLPALGIKGAAWATVTAESVALIYVITYTLRDRQLRPYSIRLTQRAFGWRRLLKISAPIAAQQFTALSIFTATFFFIATMGREALATSHIIRNMYILMFVSLMGIGQTTKTYTSAMIAEGRQAEIPQMLRRLLVLNVCGWLLLSHGLWAYPEWIARLFTDEPTIVQHTVRSMQVVIGAMFLACFSSVLINAIEGSGRTPVAMAIEISTGLTYVAIAYVIIVVYPRDIWRIWTIEWLYFGVIAGLSALYLHFGQWRHHQI